jgi:hypothetical protein
MPPAPTPYSPPLAPVRDPAETEVPKPPAVGWAVRCLWISCGVLVLSTGIALAGIAGPRNMVPLLLTSLFSLGVLVLVALLLNARRGWPRWLYLVVYLLGAASLVAGGLLAPRVFFAMPALDQVTLTAQFGLQTAALVLMFTPAAGRWLRSKR